MPVTIPPFVQFQAPLFPLKGNWNRTPPEGDLFVNAEIDWAGYGAIDAIQITVGGNSPVAMSQIVAVYVDNRRCGVDVDFLFPDSGFLLTVPSHTQGLYPVLTNALMFYVIAANSQAQDVTICQILNSMPPPIAVATTTQQNSASVVAINPAVNATTPLVAAGISGTLNTISLAIEATSAGGGAFNLSILDGTGANLWSAVYSVPAGTTINVPVDLTGLNVRFVNGLNLGVAGSAGITAGAVDVNVYYTTP